MYTCCVGQWFAATLLGFLFIALCYR